MKKTVITSVLTVALLLAQINHQFAQCESKNERIAAQDGKEKNILVPATYYKTELIPLVNLPVVEITANGNSENANGYTLPTIEVTAERTNGKLLPATKYNGQWIAMVDGPVVEITAKKKAKMNTASVFSFSWLFGNGDKE